MTELPLTFRALAVWIATLCLASVSAAQIPASFQVPILGYLFDADTHGIRPLSGIPGNSIIEAPLPLAMNIGKAGFLPDQRHAIVDSPDHPEALVLDLREFTKLPITGAPSSITAIRISKDGSSAALYYGAAKRILVVSGLPDRPVIRAGIDVSFTGTPLTRFAISDDGMVALLNFSSDNQDSLYRWTMSGGSRYLSTGSRISDMAFWGDDAVVLDSGKNQAVLVRGVREQAAPVLLADSGYGLSEPITLFVSSRNELYIGNATGTILVLDSESHILRRTQCNCTITTLSSLAASAVRLTDRLDQPLFLLDGSESDHILFIPALPEPLVEESAQ